MAGGARPVGAGPPAVLCETDTNRFSGVSLGNPDAFAKES